MNGGAVAGATVAAVIAQEQEKVINYLKDRNANSKETAVRIDDVEVKRFYGKYSNQLFFILEKEGKYWIDLDLYAKYLEQKKMLMGIVGLLLLGGVIALIVTLMINR